MGSAVNYLEDYKPVYRHCDTEYVQQASCYRNMSLLRREEENENEEIRQQFRSHN
jgi:hypothetical protein